MITALVDPEAGPASRRLAWLASDTDSVPVGSAFLRLYTSPGQDHLGEFELTVHPSSRRTGVGSDLLAEILMAARADNRRCVMSQVDADSPGDKFLAARGFRVVLTLTYARLPLATADLEAIESIAGQPRAGYRLVTWQGLVPDELAETYVASRRAMDDMPMDDADYGPTVWDIPKLRAAAEKIDQRGDHLHTVAAVRDGQIAGFTELVVPGDGRGDAQHYGTGVLPEHRGHRLALWMKAESIRRARLDYPELGGLLTDTADTNTYMRSVNDKLGYLATHRTVLRQLDL
ncbi:GNAT family N-acetyltransferase [Kribbella deserti]|uniref:GNAT family N-acetyltransferase n=1 Tax=Kribbella deserti TaxID=1926257 RepID=A0ABV6QLY4_9ACTN